MIDDTPAVPAEDGAQTPADPGASLASTLEGAVPTARAPRSRRRAAPAAVPEPVASPGAEPLQSAEPALGLLADPPELESGKPTRARAVRKTRSPRAVEGVMQSPVETPPAVQPPAAGEILPALDLQAAGDAQPRAAESAVQSEMTAQPSATDTDDSTEGGGLRERAGPRRRRGRGRGRESDGRPGPPTVASSVEGDATSPSREQEPRASDEPLPIYASGALFGLDAGDPDRRLSAAVDDWPKLHKVLADSGLGSRREMEELIVAGRVSVNGQPAHVGQRIGPNDQVRVNGRPIRRAQQSAAPRVLLYHKPSGEISTRDDPGGRSTVFSRLPRLKGARWVAVGRLDFNTEGLLVFTTSGDIANRLMHPRYGWEREYAVRILGRVDEEARQSLLDGVQLEDGPARFSILEELGGEGANAWYRVVIAEGRNREVRRMFDAVHLTVSRLVRLRFGPIALPRGLSRTRWVELLPAEVAALQRLLRGEQETATASSTADDYDEDEQRWDELPDDYEDPADSIGNRAVPEAEEESLPPELTDDEWQPSSRDAHLEGITRQVKRGEGVPRSGAGRRRRPGPAGATFVGPMDRGPGAARFGGPPAEGDRRRGGVDGRTSPRPAGVGTEGRNGRKTGPGRRGKPLSGAPRRGASGPGGASPVVPAGSAPNPQTPRQAAGGAGGAARGRRRRRPGPKKPA